MKVYGFAAAAEAIQGNIALANDNVARALDAEFGGLEQEIENKKFMLQLNMDSFDREEKRAAETRLREYEAQQEQIADAKLQRSQVMELMLSAAQNGADNQTLARINAARTPADALMAAGPYLRDASSQVLGSATTGYFTYDPITKQMTPLTSGSGAPGAAGSPGGAPTAQYGTDDYYTQLFAGSRGGKALTGDQTTPLTKSAIVLSQVSELAQQIASTDTDPILGVLREK